VSEIIAPDGCPRSAGPVLVLGLDGSSGADAAELWCRETAPRLGADVVAVHALPPLVSYVPVPLDPAAPPYGARVHAEVQVALDAWCTGLRSAGVCVRTMVVDDSPAEALMRVAAAEATPWIVVGRRGRGGFMGMVMGSVAHALSMHSPVPVVIVPARGAIS